MISQTVVQLLAAGAGVVAVPITSLIKNRGWDTKLKFAFSGVVSVLASLGVSITVDATNASEAVNYGSLGAISLAVSQIAYKIFFADTKAEDKLASIGSKPVEPAKPETE